MSPFFVYQLQFVSDVGDKNFALTIFCVVTILYLFSIGQRREAVLTAAAALSIVFSYLLKNIFKEQRPANAKPMFPFDNYSFPSSHTLIYTVFWGFLIYLAFKLTGVPSIIRILVVFAGIYFISLIGISRVYLGEHYIWDVVAGYIFGVLYLLVIIALDKKI